MAMPARRKLSEIKETLLAIDKAHASEEFLSVPVTPETWERVAMALGITGLAAMPHLLGELCCCDVVIKEVGGTRRAFFTDKSLHKLVPGATLL